MKIELIASGDEIVGGKITDTNSSYLASKLTLQGYEVTRIHAVGDDIERIKSLLTECAVRADAVIFSGGLGPTSDDLTSEAVAMAAGVNLEFRENIWRAIEERFAKINLPLSPTNRVQAMLPEGAEVLHNSIGSAPGFLLHIDNTPCYFAPGVPRELYLMFDEQILPRLEKIRPDAGVYLTRVWRTFGATESGLGEMLQDLVDENDPIRLSFRASFPEIRVGISVCAESIEIARGMLDNVSGRVEEKIGQWVYSRDGASLPEAVGRLLKEKGLKLAVAESCTGGMIGEMLTTVPGSSDYFEGGIISYSNELKIKVLGVPAEIIDKHGAVSEECARAMAEGVRVVTGAQVGLSVTGIAGPAGGTPDKPVGTIWIACSTDSGVEVRGGAWPRGEREQIRLISAYAALDLVRRTLCS